MPFERLPHVLTRADLATLLTPTYAAAQNVDDEEAHDRLSNALGDARLLDDLYGSLSDALAAQQGKRTEDAIMDTLAKRVSARKGRLAAATGPEISAVIVRINLLLNLAPDAMRELLASGKGKATLDKGLRNLGTYLVRELLK